MFRLSAPCVLFAGAMLVAGPVLAEQRLLHPESTHFCSQPLGRTLFPA